MRRFAKSLTKKAPYKETAGEVARGRVSRYGGFDAGDLLPRCVGMRIHQPVATTQRPPSGRRNAERRVHILRREFLGMMGLPAH